MWTDCPLTRQSNDKNNPNFNVYLSQPITFTLKAFEKDESDNKKMMAGDKALVRLSSKTSAQVGYLSTQDCLQVKDIKLAVRAGVVDNKNNFEDGQVEKPHSPANNPSSYKGVLLKTGEYVTSVVDMTIPGVGLNFTFARTYRSQALYSGVLGWNWSHNYNINLKELPNGDIIYNTGDMRRERFTVKNQAGIYTSPAGWFTELQKMEDGTFHHIYPDRTIEYFNAKGRLIKIQDRNHNKLEFIYNLSGQLTTVKDTMGRIYTLEYHPFTPTSDKKLFTPKSGRLWKLTGPTGRVVEYSYHEKTAALTGVNYFSERTVEYKYDYPDGDAPDLDRAHNLESIKDPKGQIALTITYSDGEDKVDSIDESGAKTTFAKTGLTAEVIDPKNYKKVFSLTEE